MITVAGLDLSLTSTGLSVGDTLIAISTKTKGVERLDYIANVICGHLAQAENPIVIIEGYAFASRNSQAHAIGELGGVVRWHLWKAGISWVDVPPTCRAKFATGKGNASKGEVLSAVSARTGIVWTGSGADDMCDAWILQECGLAKIGKPRYDWPQSHLTALEKVDWSAIDTLLNKDIA